MTIAMANTTSKLLIGGTVAIVLLMMFSAVPVAAEETNDEPVYEDISVDYDTDPGTHIYDWTWDKETFTLTLRGIVYAHTIFINNNSGVDAYATVIVLGDVYLDSGGSNISFEGKFNGAKITGGGKITMDNNAYDLHYYGKGDLIFDDISLDFLFAAIQSDSNIIFENCPSIKVCYTPPYPVYAKGTIKAINSNLFIEVDSGIIIMRADGGITLPCEPTSSDNGLKFDNGEWISGTTKEISGDGEDAHYNFTIGSYVPPKEESSINMNDVTLGITAAAAIVLIGVGSIYAGKH